MDRFDADSQHPDVIDQFDAAEAALTARNFQAQLNDALEFMPSKLQDHIAVRVGDDADLFEHVLVGSRGSFEMADLLIEKARVESQRDHPTHNASWVKSRLADIEKRIERKREELEETS